MIIGHIYRSLSLGGMQRGAGAILKVHHDMGHKLVVFTRDPVDGKEYDISVPFERVVLGGGSYRRRADVERKRKLHEGLSVHKCDLVIHHEYYAKSLVDDLELLTSLGVPTLVQWHACFTALHMSDAWDGQVCHQLDIVKRYARGMLAFSRVDCTFFELLGIPARHIPYSDPDIFDENPTHKAGVGREILWPSRMSKQKQPLEAIKIFERVLEQMPDAHLTMLGDGPLRVDVETYLASRPTLSAKVSFPGFVNDVVSYFKDADLVLMTSEYEGFCHSIMEAKMAAIPVVGYEMDYLDTTRPGTGYVSVPQGDVQGAAAKVCELLRDGDERHRLGALGRKDFEWFASLDQQALYHEAFELALAKTPPPPCVVTDASLVSKVLNMLLRHVDAHSRNSKVLRVKAEEKRRRSFLYRLFTKLAKCFAG